MVKAKNKKKTKNKLPSKKARKTKKAPKPLIKRARQKKIVAKKTILEAVKKKNLGRIKPMKHSQSSKNEKSLNVKALEIPVVDDKKVTEEEVVLTDAEGRRYCRVQDCDQIAIVETYCRYHYLLHWKKIQYRKKILADNKFHKYIEELTAKYPDKFLEVIRKDLSSQKNFLAAIQEMEIEESADDLEVDDKSYMDDMRGLGAEAGSPEDAGEDY